MPASGVADRSAFLAVLEAHLARDAMGVAALRIDLDRFSRIRQVFGAVVADVVRNIVVQRIQALAGGREQVLALAEDSFLAAVRTPGGHEVLDRVGMRFVESVSAPIQLDGLPPIAVGSNVGIAAAATFAVADPLRLMAGAELAVQRANAIGSRRIIVYQVDSNDDPTRLPELFADMLGAIQRHEFIPFYQPVLSLADDAVVGAEVLIRWEHPRFGLLLPGDFIAEAERSGLIRDIDGQMWAQAWTFLQRSAEADAIDMGVNLSVADLDFPDLPDKVQRLVGEIGVDPTRLVFEVTETAMSQDWMRARQRLTALRDLGCRIAIDDFGSGHMYLDRLNSGLFDFLKLDRSLIVGAGDAAGRDLLVGVVSLGHSLGMRVIAEGIETEEQLSTVRDAGCDLAQGYLLGRPTDGADFTRTYL